MKINGIKVQGNLFAYEGCHKIYVLGSNDDFEQAVRYGYDIYPIEEIKKIYNNSCSLRFIHPWSLHDKYDYVGQFEKAVFEYSEDEKVKKDCSYYIEMSDSQSRKACFLQTTLRNTINEALADYRTFTFISDYIRVYLMAAGKEEVKQLGVLR
jgi:hypothetical protein